MSSRVNERVQTFEHCSDTLLFLFHDYFLTLFSVGYVQTGTPPNQTRSSPAAGD